jgi:hypothetical protein
MSEYILMAVWSVLVWPLMQRIPFLSSHFFCTESAQLYILQQMLKDKKEAVVMKLIEIPVPTLTKVQNYLFILLRISHL